ncbi:MAG: hypothetical protein AAF599_00140 [Bacteroidota bacterium]
MRYKVDNGEVIKNVEKHIIPKDGLELIVGAGDEPLEFVSNDGMGHYFYEMPEGMPKSSSGALWAIGEVFKEANKIDEASIKGVTLEDLENGLKNRTSITDANTNHIKK